MSGGSIAITKMEGINALNSALSNSPHDFLQSTSALHAASLMVAKQFLDPLAASVVASKKNKRRNNNVVLDRIYLDGFDAEQVWEQVRQLVGEVEESLDLPKSLIEATAGALVAVPKLVENIKKRKAIHLEYSDADTAVGSEEDSEEEEEVEEEEEEEEREEEDEGEEEGEEEEDWEDEEMGGVRHGEDGTEPDNEDVEDVELHDADLDELNELDAEEEGCHEKPVEIFVQDVHGLNDGFFAIDDFNRQTEMFEQMDYIGDVAESDEEIDYNADPQQIKISHSTDSDDEVEKEDGYLDESLDDDQNANDIMYADFFAPPPKKGLSVSQQKKLAWRTEAPKLSEGDKQQEWERVQSDMARANRDLFDDEFSEDEAEGSDPAKRKSAYERRQSDLAEKIRKLELENVSKKKWTLIGEARASQRPLNSLLEEDLDFERIGKPVPVITQEVKEEIEDVIKRRILAGDFDELQKRDPLYVSSEFRRGRIELDDSKPQSSLAEVYEREHLQSIDPNGHPNVKDEKLCKEYEEISLMFSNITKKLDALSSWHYTPKPPKPSISIVSDAPAISMEEAQPTAGGGGGAAAEASMLAPQDIYNPIKDRKAVPRFSSVKEVVGKSGAPVSVAEMTTEEKRRRRKQKKERQRKSNAAAGKTHGGKAKEGSERDVLDILKKGGVKFIGKRGEKTDVQGKELKEKKVISSSSLLKL